jgi:hypothetical protein
MKSKNIIFVILLIVLVLAVYIFVKNFQFISWDFRNNLWSVAYLLLNGQEPYSVYQQFPGTNALWLPMTVGLFLPLGLLDPSIASSLWLLANIAMLGSIIWMTLGTKRPSLLLFTLVLLIIFLSPFVISHLYYGQITIFFVLMVLLAVKLRHLFAGFLVGLLVAASLAKPQLAFLVLLGFMISSWKDKKLNGILIFMSGIALGVLVLSLPFWVASPNWWRGYLDALQHNPAWAHPNLFTFMQTLFGGPGLVVWALIALSIFLVNIIIWTKYHPETALVWSLALTTLVTPYLFSYDFVLLVPLFCWVLFRSKMLIKQIFLTLGWLAGSGFMLWMRFSTENDDRLYWWFPILIITWVLMVDRFSQFISELRTKSSTYNQMGSSD